MIDFFEKGSLLRVKLKPKTMLLKEGEIARRMYFINSGCIRAWLNKEGREITLQFFFEEDAVTALESFLNETLSPIYIDLLKNIN